MILAEQQRVKASIKHEQLDIRERENKFLLANLANLSVTAALFIGFTIFGLFADNEAQGTPFFKRSPYLRAFMFGSFAVAIGLPTVTVVKSTLTTIWGEDLALRGPTGSMARANDAMREETFQTAYFLMMGVVAVFMGVLGYVWMVLEFRDRILCTTVLVVFFCLVLNNAHRVYRRFFLNEEFSHSAHMSFAGYEPEQNTVKVYTRSIGDNAKDIKFRNTEYERNLMSMRDSYDFGPVSPQSRDIRDILGFGQSSSQGNESSDLRSRHSSFERNASTDGIRRSSSTGRDYSFETAVSTDRNIRSHSMGRGSSTNRNWFGSSFERTASTDRIRHSSSSTGRAGSVDRNRRRSPTERTKSVDRQHRSSLGSSFAAGERNSVAIVNDENLSRVIEWDDQIE